MFFQECIDSQCLLSVFLQIFILSVMCSGDYDSIELGSQLLTCPFPFLIQPQSTRSGSWTGSSMTSGVFSYRLPEAESAQLVLTAAKEYTNAAARVSDSEIGHAKKCLQLLGNSTKEAVSEMNLIRAFEMLDGLGLEMIPLKSEMQLLLYSLPMSHLEHCHFTYCTSVICLQWCWMMCDVSHFQWCLMTCHTMTFSGMLVTMTFSGMSHNDIQWRVMQWHSVTCHTMTFSNMSHNDIQWHVSVRLCVILYLSVRMCENKLDIIKDLLEASPQVYKQHRKVGVFVCLFVCFLWMTVSWILLTLLATLFFVCCCLYFVCLLFVYLLSFLVHRSLKCPVYLEWTLQSMMRRQHFHRKWGKPSYYSSGRDLSKKMSQWCWNCARKWCMQGLAQDGVCVGECGVHGGVCVRR